MIAWAGIITAGDRVAKQASNFLAFCGVSLLLIYAGLSVADIAVRNVAGKPIHGLEDIATLLIPVIVTSFLPYVMTERANIRATLVGARLGPPVAARLDLFGDFVLLAFLTIATIEFAIYAVDSRTQTTLILRAPIAPSLFTALFLLSLAVCAQFLVMVAGISRKAPVERRENT